MMPETLPNGWSTVVLQDKFEFTKKPRGLRIDDYPEIPFVPMEFVPQGPLCFSKFNLKSPDAISSGTYFEPNDLLLSKITPSFENGKQGIIQELPIPFGIATTEVIPIKGREDESDIRFLAFYLVKDDVRKWMAGKMEGSTGRQRLPISLVKNLELPFPPFLEQRSIAAVLSKTQEAIAAQQDIIDRTLEMKKALMYKLFTEGLRGEPTKKTEIGPTPRSWDVLPIGTFAKFQGGFAFKSTDYLTEGIPLFKISNVSFGKTSWDEVSFLPEQFLDTYRDFELRPGDVVMAMTRPIVEGGIKVSRISDSDCPCLLNQRVGRFILSETVDSEYLFQFLFSKDFIKSIGDGAGGSQQPNISAKQIEKITIPFPAHEEQVEIGQILKSFDTKLIAHENKLLSLQDLLKTMLHELMTGNIRTTSLMEA